MHCDYFDAGRCRSCSLMGTPYDQQLRAKQDHCRARLDGDGVSGPAPIWEAPFTSRSVGFRNKAKLVVGGSRQDPTVGILDRGGHGIDLRHCGLYDPGLAEVVRQVPDIIAGIGLAPYAVPHRSGELKHVLITHSPAGEQMIRFVLRSPGQVGRIRRALPGLQERLPGVRVVSVNLQPTHAAIIEGSDELLLTQEEELPMPVNDVRLRLRSRSFFQTNTAVAAGLYQQVREWVNQVDPRSLWDLYCGVGGFALHSLTRPSGSPRSVVGIEVSAEAIASARASAAEFPGRADFLVGDVTEHLLSGGSGQPGRADPPELVVVNPPRRGIGADLAA